FVPDSLRARNHGFGGELADEQTDRSRSRPQRDHRESASQSSYEENGSEIGGRSGQDGRSTRGDSHQIPTLNITLCLPFRGESDCRSGADGEVTSSATLGAQERAEFHRQRSPHSKPTYSSPSANPALSYARRRHRGPTFVALEKKVRSRGRGPRNLDHRRRCFGAYRDSPVDEVDGIFCTRVCFGERILVLAPTERNVLRHCGCGDARYERYRAAGLLDCSRPQHAGHFHYCLSTGPGSRASDEGRSSLFSEQAVRRTAIARMCGAGADKAPKCGCLGWQRVVLRPVQWIWNLTRDRCPAQTPPGGT